MKKMKRKPQPLLLGRYDFVFPDERGATARIQYTDGEIYRR